ncbi:uncharacterized protein [Diadema antillarum]|uniref:uncharacterized protein n=1 Tax=Diadema antillarum TaxID=105358 RepID=UPI003A840650
MHRVVIETSPSFVQVLANRAPSIHRQPVRGSLLGRAAHLCWLGCNYAEGSLAPEVTIYTQLKVEVSALQEENADLQQKLMKHQNSVLSSKAAVKDLQKENKELKQRLDDETRQLKDLLSSSQDELSTKTSFLETKLQSCEEALEHSGINPVTLVSLEMDQEQRRKDFAEATTKAHVLRERVEENINVTRSSIADMKKILKTCETILAVEKGGQDT